MITLELPDELLSVSHQTPEQFSKEVRASASAMLFLENKVSLGKAARLSGLSRLEFEAFLAAHHLPNSLLDETSLAADRNALRNL